LAKALYMTPWDENALVILPNKNALCPVPPHFNINLYRKKHFSWRL